MIQWRVLSIVVAAMFVRDLPAGAQSTSASAATDTFAVSIYIDPAVAPVGLPRLRDRNATSLPPREIRIGSTGSMAYDLTPLLRLYQAGGGWAGQLLVWITHPDSAFHDVDPSTRRFVEGLLASHGCAWPATPAKHVTCVVSFGREPDWTRIAAELEALGAWELPPGSALPKGQYYISDLPGVVIEASDHGRYTASYYYGPTDAHPASARALRVMQVLEQVFAHAKRERRQVRWE